MLIEAGLLLAAYGGTRLFEKVRKKPIKAVALDRENKEFERTEPETLPQTVNNDKDKKQLVNNRTNETSEFRLKVSYASLALATTRQFFYSSPLLTAASIGIYIYNAVPFLKETEKVVLEEKRLSGQVFETMAYFAAIATNQYFAASFMEMIYYLSYKIKAKTQDKSKDMLINVFDERPRSVWILKDGVELEVPVESISVDDVLVINTGEIVAIDGIIIEGAATIDQRALTGESQPAEKGVDDPVYAMTTLVAGRILVRIEKAGLDTTIAQIGQILNRTTEFKNETLLKAEQWADKAAWPQMGVTGLAFAATGLPGAAAALNTNFGYRMKLGGSLATLNYLNHSSQHSILIKDGRSLDLLTEVDTILFDKTGTLTQEQPEIGSMTVYGRYTPDEILVKAAAAEQKLEHPIARAIVQKAREINVDLPPVDDSSYQMGYGITVVIDNQTIQVGSPRFMTMEGMAISAAMEETMTSSHDNGCSLIMVAIDNKVEGTIEIKPVLRPEIKGIISGLRQRGIKHLAIVSGDHEKPTHALAKALGMDDYFYDVLPEDKARIVERLQEEGKSVCFIGDGVNDTIAIKKANVSISIHGAASVATDLAQVVFMDGSLRHLCTLFDIANNLKKQLRKTLTISLLPVPVILFGIFFLHFGLLATIVVNQAGFWLGLGDAMSPLEKKKKKKKNNKQGKL